MPLALDPQAWASAQARALALAETAMPEIPRRLAFAATLVEAGSVEHRGQFGQQDYQVHNPDGTACTVHAKNPTTCTCAEWRAHASEKGYACTHILAVRLYTRALELLEPPPEEDGWPPEDAPLPAGEGQPAVVFPCPEAVFSLCLRGTLRGTDAQLTVRGQCEREFLAHVAAVQGLLDPPQGTTALEGGAMPASPAPAPPQEGWCGKHNAPMKLQQGKDGAQWWSHKNGDAWCKGK